MRKKEMILFALLILFLIGNISALYFDDESKISFGHVLRIKNISISEISQGKPGTITINLFNNANYPVTDIQAKVLLPPEVQFINDVNKIRIGEIKSGGEKEIKYNIIPVPDAKDGVYGAVLLIDYITHFGVNDFNVGENNEDNYTFGIIIKSMPSIFMQLDNSGIYNGNTIGDITLKFVNNGTSNIKFLTVNLLETNDFELISDSRNYIGDLDSDDFESVTFKIKLISKEKTIKIPVKISYTDALNNPYNEEFYAYLKLRDANEVGIKDGNLFITSLIIIIIIIIIGFFFYRRHKRKKEKHRI